MRYLGTRGRAMLADAASRRTADQGDWARQSKGDHRETDPPTKAMPKSACQTCTTAQKQRCMCVCVHARSRMQGYKLTGGEGVLNRSSSLCPEVGLRIPPLENNRATKVVPVSRQMWTQRSGERDLNSVDQARGSLYNVKSACTCAMSGSWPLQPHKGALRRLAPRGCAHVAQCA